MYNSPIIPPWNFRFFFKNFRYSRSSVLFSRIMSNIGITCLEFVFCRYRQISWKLKIKNWNIYKVHFGKVSFLKTFSLRKSFRKKIISKTPANGPCRWSLVAIVTWNKSACPVLSIKLSAKRKKFREIPPDLASCNFSQIFCLREIHDNEMFY